jgi:uncharacterized protein YcfJ
MNRTINSKSKLAALASAAMLIGISGSALADHQAQTARNDHALYDYAEVLSSQPIINYVTVKTPVRECWEEIEYYTVDRPARGTGAPTLLGAVIGSVIGHQIGSGRGNDAATIAGGLIGAAIGNDSARRRNRDIYGVETHGRPVQRCKTSYRQQREERIEGYRVTYRYQGQKYQTRMPQEPGRKIRVRVDVRPAA